MEFKIDGVTYNLKEKQDFSWLSKYGKVFSCIDQTGSGCINFGVQDGSKRYFVKIAGAKTLNAEVSQQESIDLLKKATNNYKQIKHPNLIKLVKSFDVNEFFVSIYEWAEGECLFDHWNFDKYDNDPTIITPAQKFKKLDINKKLNVIDKLFTFFIETAKSGYIAVDFYDSSILYDFTTDKVAFCDIDLFRKAPTFNDLGTDYFGTKRLKAPEENILNAPIDELTNEFTLGAIIFDMLSETDEENIKQRYSVGNFIPTNIERFCLNENLYNILLRATSLDRNNRFKSIKDFYKSWNNELKFYKKMENVK
jgi:serine/threonine-protein kinase